MSWLKTYYKVSVRRACRLERFRQATFLYKSRRPEQSLPNSPAIGVGLKYTACNVIETLNLAVEQYGKPECIRVDNGPEFISRELDVWEYSRGVQLDFSRPGKPLDNAFIESFNSRFRQECLINIGSCLWRTLRTQ